MQDLFASTLYKPVERVAIFICLLWKRQVAVEVYCRTPRVLSLCTWRWYAPLSCGARVRLRLSSYSPGAEPRSLWVRSPGRIHIIRHAYHHRRRGIPTFIQVFISGYLRIWYTRYTVSGKQWTILFLFACFMHDVYNFFTEQYELVSYCPNRRTSPDVERTIRSWTGEMILLVFGQYVQIRIKHGKTHK